MAKVSGTKAWSGVFLDGGADIFRCHVTTPSLGHVAVAQTALMLMVDGLATVQEPVAKSFSSRFELRF